MKILIHRSVYGLVDEFFYCKWIAEKGGISNELQKECEKQIRRWTLTIRSCCREGYRAWSGASEAIRESSVQDKRGWSNGTAHGKHWEIRNYESADRNADNGRILSNYLRSSQKILCRKTWVYTGAGHNPVHERRWLDHIHGGFGAPVRRLGWTPNCRGSLWFYYEKVIRKIIKCKKHNLIVNN